MNTNGQNTIHSSPSIANPPLASLHALVSLRLIVAVVKLNLWPNGLELMKSTAQNHRYTACPQHGPTLRTPHSSVRYPPCEDASALSDRYTFSEPYARRMKSSKSSLTPCLYRTSVFVSSAMCHKPLSRYRQRFCGMSSSIWSSDPNQSGDRMFLAICLQLLRVKNTAGNSRVVSMPATRTNARHGHNPPNR